MHVRVTDSEARAARQISVHDAISDRDSQEAGITDAARQAYYYYRHAFFAEIQDDPERWHPRRRSGETACTIASLAGVEDPQLASTVALVATLNTELDAVSEENFKLRQQLGVREANLEAIEHAIGGPLPRAPLYRGESPERKRTCYGTAEARTTIEP